MASGVTGRIVLSPGASYFYALPESVGKGDRSMPEITIHDDQHFERALKPFTLPGPRKHRYHEKPSERKKHKQAVARRKGRRDHLWS